ncbi:MAG: double-strand break repair helicase AddA [Azospirillum sp.]|nr:double-strand break repair helicase AddA [Azospirillum sp.]
MTAGDPIEAGLANQRAAADPDFTVWVSANAGAGKTHVLTTRIVNLLLRAVRPSAILCLTFTKAAAAEMRGRLARLLAEWATCTDADLRTALRERLGRAPDDAEMARARVLFASVLEAPGGLRIQTIHAFCESLLKRFPLEAGVPPHFAVADEATAGELLTRARAALVADPASAASLRIVASAANEARVFDLIDAVVGEGAKLDALAEAGIEAEIARRRAAFGLGPDDTPASLRAAYVAGLDMPALRAAIGAMGTQGSDANRTQAAVLSAWLDGDKDDPEPWLKILLTEKGTPRQKWLVKKFQDSAPEHAAVLFAEQRRAESFATATAAAEIHRRSSALLRLAATVRHGYAARKAAAALLDYDDLIAKAVRLLEAGAAWVLYKLDGGIEHVLVDEAQDTAPAQWRVVRALTAEYFAGEGTAARGRTVFVVGDEKQSIFSFQGADLDAFAATRTDFAARAGTAWREVPLQVSFRSAPAVLEIVDRAFAGEGGRKGVSQSEIAHRARRAGAGGRVDLWPLFLEDEKVARRHWDRPVDYEGTTHPSTRLATAIASTLAAWIGRETLPALGRTVEAGDVLILVRKRDRFFEAMVKALKRAGVPVAGADRLVLGAEIAVMDLLALARFCLQPGDDLSLAEALKSPLFGFDDEDLFALAHGREGRLWRALRTRAEERPLWLRARETLRALRAKADFAAPYEFFAGALDAADGKAAMLARLGPDAADPLDEFLAAALAFERAHPPSLQQFLAWFERGGAQVKRDMEGAHGRVRVMTVHGAKGLEAPVVFLPDTCGLPAAPKAPLWSVDAPAFPLWWPTGKDTFQTCADAKAAATARALAEYRRLLYVAATRARDRLVVCGWAKDAAKPESWYTTLAAAIESHPAAKPDKRPDGADIVVVERTPVDVDAAAAPGFVSRPVNPLPGWAAARTAPAEPEPPKPLVPSREAEAPAAASPLAAARAQGLKRGTLIHRLLQTLPDLPADARAAAARRFLDRPGHGLTEAERAEIARETLALFELPEFAAAWSGEGLAEAAIVARVGGRALAGRIDRIVVTADAVHVIDFKTNRPPPERVEDVPPAYLAQLAAYRAALIPLYPDRPIRAALLWTFAPRLQAIPAALLDAHAP